MTVMPHADVPRQSEAGFTLVELLVGVILLSLLTIAMFGGLRFGIFAWNHGTVHADRLDRILSVHSLLRRLIADTYPYYTAAKPALPNVMFAGTQSTLSFLARTPTSLGGNGRMQYTLITEGGSTRSSLILTSRPELSSEGSITSQTRTSLVDNADVIEFAYFGKTRTDQDITWHNSWAGQPNLPVLVRLRIKLAGRDWPDLIVAPRVEVDVGCIYDALTKRCRAR